MQINYYVGNNIGKLECEEGMQATAKAKVAHSSRRRQNNFITPERYVQYGKKKEMPNKWKMGVLCPTHKKGDKLNCSNYRYIILLEIN